MLKGRHLIFQTKSWALAGVCAELPSKRLVVRMVGAQEIPELSRQTIRGRPVYAGDKEL